MDLELFESFGTSGRIALPLLEVLEMMVVDGLIDLRIELHC